MGQTKHIVIIEENPHARAAIMAEIHAWLPGIECRFENADKAKSEAGSIHLCLYERGASSPDFVAAQDGFEKPVRIGALLDRIKRHLSVKSEAPVIRIGAYELDTADGTLRHEGGTPLRLTEKENHILRLLHQQAGRPVERDVLLAEVWGYGADIETHTLETHIYRLRQKIENDAAAPKVLLTSVNGYLLRI